MMNQKVLIAGIAVAFVAGIGITVVVLNGQQSAREQQIQERLLAQQKLESMKSEKQQRLAQQVARAEARRLEAEAQAAAAAAAAAEAARPRYDPQRLRYAAKLRQWVNVTIPDYNINCWLKTNWKDGRVYFRLAMLGQREALQQFQGSWPEYLLTFTDAAGTNLHSIIVPSSSMRWAPIGTNNGIPTLELDSNDECSLEIYERSSNWNFNWQI